MRFNVTKPATTVEQCQVKSRKPHFITQCHPLNGIGLINGQTPHPYTFRRPCNVIDLRYQQCITSFEYKINSPHIPICSGGPAMLLTSDTNSA